MRNFLGILLVGLAAASCTCSPIGAEAIHFACTTGADCAGGFECNRGECRSTQPEGAACVGSGAFACGAPGSACAQACTDGKLSACNAPSGPVDLQTDRDNCGECGRTCSSALACVQGVCTCLKDTDCVSGEKCAPNGVCVSKGDLCLGVVCPAAQVCRAGSCASVACLGVACPSGEQCLAGVCLAIDACHIPVPCDGGTCEGPPRPDGTSCNDRNRCSHDDACKAGACEGTLYTCTPAAACQTSICAGDGTCDVGSEPNGTACLACTGASSCMNGVCGSGQSCPAPTQCEQSVACLPDGGCLASPRSGGPCDDANACTFGDSCGGGLCSGTASPCPAATVCESTVVCAGDGGCIVTLKSDGTPCLGCNGMMGTCGSGVCSVGNGACPAPTACQESVSCLSDGGCLPVSKPDNTACDDGVACSQNDVCTSGACSGTSYMCPPPTTCQLTVACGGDGGCVVTQKDAGTACDDGNACTITDACLAGSCTGTTLPMQTWYRDVDNDGTGVAATTMTACLQPAGYVLTAGDCNDNDADVYRTIASLQTDADNDGWTTSAAAGSQCVGGSSVINTRTYYRSSSGAFSWVIGSLGTDCNDASAAVLGGTGWFTDGDMDGVGGGAAMIACVQPGGTVAGGGDCNDGDGDVFQTQGAIQSDADNDGYTVGASATQCVGGTMTINGRTYYRGTSGAFVWMKANLSLGTDCYDSNANARPGQTAYFTVNRGDGSFDYNCASGTELQLTMSLVGTAYNATVTTIPGTGCTTAQPSGVSGWVGAAPTCGNQATFRHCHTYSDTACNTLVSDPFTFNTGCAAGGSWFSSDHAAAATVSCR